MDSVLYEVKKQVAFLTLNRPEKYNAFNREMALALQAKLEEAEKDENVRCVVISGTGKAFSSGQDLTEIKDPTGPEMQRILPEQLNPIVTKLRTIQKPVLAVVNGIAAGAAANIALCCDIVIAAESAIFIQAFTKIGLIPDSGGTYILPRLVGLQKATALMMLADNVSAKEAAEMGMIYKSFPDENLVAEAGKIAERLSTLPTKALVFTRMALDEAMHSDFEQQLANEAAWQAKAAKTKDFSEGVTAFLQKRAPVFEGK